MHRSKVRGANAQAPRKTRLLGLILSTTTTKPPSWASTTVRAAQVRAKVNFPTSKRETLLKEILSNIEHGSKVYTDSARAYDLLRYNNYIHKSVNHS